MLGSQLLRALALVAATAKGVQSRAVFAHYMVGTVDEDHAHKDIDDAMAMGIDAFALNVGDATPQYVTNTLSHLFGYAAYRGFKLFISMDISAAGGACTSSGNMCNGAYDYQWIWDAYKGHAAYYRIDNKALISTFSAGSYTNDYWQGWKNSLANDMVFIPDFDGTEGYYDGADGWWNYWGNVVDGIFSWESTWPVSGGSNPGSIDGDMKPFNAARAHGKSYMMGLSALQYKNAWGGNWYRLGDLNLPKRMENILNMADKPDYVEVITWNDGPESHYIGNIWPEMAGETDSKLYANQDQWPHSGWQPLIASFANAYRAGKTAAQVEPVSGQAVGAMWYKTILTDTVSCPSTKPGGFSAGSNKLYWSLVLSSSAGSGWKVRVYSGNGASTTQTLQAGLNYGSSDATLTAGAQRMELLNPSGAVVKYATGGYCVSSGCPQGIYNSNYQVVPLVDGSSGARTCTSF